MSTFTYADADGRGSDEPHARRPVFDARGDLGEPPATIAQQDARERYHAAHYAEDIEAASRAWVARYERRRLAGIAARKAEREAAARGADAPREVQA